jgi:hypothetical protein
LKAARILKKATSRTLTGWKAPRRAKRGHGRIGLQEAVTAADVHRVAEDVADRVAGVDLVVADAHLAAAVAAGAGSRV